MFLCVCLDGPKPLNVTYEQCMNIYADAYEDAGIQSCVPFEVFYMYLVYTPDRIVLVSRYCVTCLNLLFSNRRVQIYI